MSCSAICTGPSPTPRCRFRASTFTLAWVAVALLAPAGARGGPVSVLQTSLNPENGHTYHLLTESNWTDAEAFARTLGGHLTTIDDAAENAWVYQTFTDGGVTNRHLWIGLSDDGVEAWADGFSPGWVWAGGGRLGGTGFRAWSFFEPNQFAGLEEDFVHMWAPADPATGQWNDVSDIPSLMPAGGTYTAPLHGVVELAAGTPPLTGGGDGPDAAPVPLPPAGWTGLVTLAGWIVLRHRALHAAALRCR